MSIAFRNIARLYAAREHLKIDFSLEGNVFTSLSIRNLHIEPNGPTDIESIDADLVRADYSFWGLLRHGRPGFLKNLEVRSARIAVNPAKTPRKPPNKKAGIKPPGFPTTLFPDRVRLADISLVIRDKPHDFFVQDVDVDLNQSRAGKLRIARLQLPNGQHWSTLSGATTYEKKNLILTALRLNEEDQIDLLNLDASELTKKRLDLKLKASVGGGKVSGYTEWTKQRFGVSRKITLHIENVSAAAVNRYANLPGGYLGGRIEKVDIDLIGKLNVPSSWNGTIDAKLPDFRIGGIGFNSCTFDAWAKDGQAGLESADLVQNENHIYLRGWTRLPDRFDEIGQSTGSLDINAAALDLGKLTGDLPMPVTGTAQLNGKIETGDGKLQAHFLAAAATIGFDGGTFDRVLANISAIKEMKPENRGKPWFTDLTTTTNLEASNILYRDRVFDSLKTSFKGKGEVLTVQNLTLSRRQNTVNAQGHYHLPVDLRDFDATEADADVVLHATDMGAFEATEKKMVAGPMEMNGQFHWKEKKVGGSLSLFGRNIRVQDLAYDHLNLQCTVADNVAYINDFSAQLKEPGFVMASGSLDLHPPFRYTGRLSANVPNLSALKPLLSISGNQKALAGSLVIGWEGSGEPRTLKNSGKLKLTVENGQYGGLKSIRANIDATYTKEKLDVPVFFISTDKMNFETIVESKEDTLEITKIALNQGEAKYATGYVSIPFIWKNIWKDAPMVPSNGKVVANFQSENVDIGKLFKDFEIPAPIAGIFSIKLDAGGTVADLNARLDLQMRDLRNPQVPKLQPASFDLSAQVEHDELRAVGKLQQRDIQPLEISANMPFDIPQIIRQGRVPAETPVAAKLHLPRSSVNFLRQVLPEVQVLDGNVGLDVDVGGKYGQPVLSGNADMSVNFLRFSNATLPAVRDFKARLDFKNDRLTLQQFGGELAGGRFTVDGGVTFPTVTSANLDLHLKANSVLVARNDTMTMRSDADLKVAGPFTHADVTGKVAITNSRFLKNIDLVPIGLPGRPAPQPPASQPDFSITALPFRDWKYDVAVVTKDPLLLRGNLATGSAICDLKFAGTGVQPGLSGTVKLENVDATLPFSRLSISNGSLYFDPSDSLNPKIDFNGTSVIQDYTVHAYVHGNLLAPEAIFTSEPPLPQEEIISLLATGTTREQLTGDNSAVAGRAAMLLVQQTYRKIFKKGEQSGSSNVFDRLDVDVGQLDQRTGQRQATARFRINKQFLLVGDLEVGGDFRVKLRYLIRFR